ncbi:MAG: hypothetical protein ACREU7_14355 [Burkholderiales bacterium]
MRHLFAGLALLLLAFAGHAADELQVKRHFGVKYVSGGMTAEQRKLLDEMAPKFPVQLYFHVEGTAKPISGVRVVARDVKGDVVLEVDSEGPVLFFDATGGRYTIEAEYKGEKLSHTKDLVGRRYLVLEYKFGGS